jgi:hypothetical protein
MNDVIWAGTQFLAVGNGGTIMTSPDGIEWTAQKSGTEFRKLNIDMFVATAAASSFPNDGRVFTSADGQTWVEVVISNESSATLSLMWHEGALIAGGVVGRLFKSPDGVISAGVSTTDDGMTWHHFHIDADYDTRGLAWGSNRNE